MKLIKAHLRDFIWFYIFLNLWIVSVAKLFDLLRYLNVKNVFILVNLPILIGSIIFYIILTLIFSKLVKNMKNVGQE